MGNVSPVPLAEWLLWKWLWWPKIVQVVFIMPLDVMTSTGPWWVLLPLLGFGLQLKATEQRLETVCPNKEGNRCQGCEDATGQYISCLTSFCENTVTCLPVPLSSRLTSEVTGMGAL